MQPSCCKKEPAPVVHMSHLSMYIMQFSHASCFKTLNTEANLFHKKSEMWIYNCFKLSTFSPQVCESVLRVKSRLLLLNASRKRSHTTDVQHCWSLQTTLYLTDICSRSHETASSREAPWHSAQQLLFLRMSYFTPR